MVITSGSMAARALGFGTTTFVTQPSVSYTGSAYFNSHPSSDQELSVPSSAFQFGSGDYTVEFWVNVISYTTYSQFVGQWGTYQTFQFSIISNKLGLQNSSGFLDSGVSTLSGFTGSWHYLAYVRTSGTNYLYLDGTRYTMTGTNTTINANTSLNTGVGQVIDQVGYGLNGYINGLRVTVGVARYTGSSMTVPSKTFATGIPNDTYWNNVSLYMPLNSNFNDISSNAYSVTNVNSVVQSSTHP